MDFCTLYLNIMGFTQAFGFPFPHYVQFYYIFDGDPKPENGFIDLDDDKPGLGLTISKEFNKDFNIIT